jgi:hypothetical protein
MRIRIKRPRRQLPHLPLSALALMPMSVRHCAQREAPAGRLGRGSSQPTKVGSMDVAQPVLPTAKSMPSVSLDGLTCARLQ